MLILSKYKDYYDYLSGVFGTDSKIVLDRRVFDKFEVLSDDDKFIQVFVCGYIYEGFVRDKKFYWGRQLLELLTKEEREKFDNSKNQEKVYIRYRKSSTYNYVRNGVDLHLEPFVDKVNHNLKQNCPIMILHRLDDFLKFPVLREIGISSILPPKEIYLMLTEWLAPKDKEQEPRPDKEKIVSAGFDLKTSFRNPIK
jgi:hypothetical protein